MHNDFFFFGANSHFYCFFYEELIDFYITDIKHLKV